MSHSDPKCGLSEVELWSHFGTRGMQSDLKWRGARCCLTPYDPQTRSVAVQLCTISRSLEMCIEISRYRTHHTRYRRCARRYPVPPHDITRRAHDNAGLHDTTPRRAISRACLRYYRAAHGIANTHDNNAQPLTRYPGTGARYRGVGALPRYRARTTILLTGLRNRGIPRYRDPPFNVERSVYG